MSSNDVFGMLMLLFPVWPFVGVGSAVVLYLRHRDRVEPERRIPLAAYVLAVVVCGGIAGVLGISFGIQWGCSLPASGNLCGLIGFLVVGPICGALAMFLVGFALTRRR